MELKTMNDLETLIDKSIKMEKPLSLFIEMPGFPMPELITNPVPNLQKKLEYYRNTYDENLEHKHAKGIKIVGYTLKAIVNIY